MSLVKDKFKALGFDVLPMVQEEDKKNTKRIRVGDGAILKDIPFFYLKMVERVNEADFAALIKEARAADNKGEWLGEFIDSLRQIGNIEIGSKKGAKKTACLRQLGQLEKDGGFFEVKNSFGTPVQQRFSKLGFKLKKITHTEKSEVFIASSGAKACDCSYYVLSSILDVNDGDLDVLAKESREAGDVNKWFDDLAAYLKRISSHKARVKQSNSAESKAILRSLKDVGGFAAFRDSVAPAFEVFEGVEVRPGYGSGLDKLVKAAGVFEDDDFDIANVFDDKDEGKTSGVVQAPKATGLLGKRSRAK